MFDVKNFFLCGEVKYSSKDIFYKTTVMMDCTHSVFFNELKEATLNSGSCHKVL